MRRKKGKEQEAVATDDPRVTPEDVQQVEFRLAFRGYRERDVDAFLDRVTEDLSAYLEENRRLREAGGSLPPSGASLAIGSSGEAEEILARAREEAAAIVRRAEEQAAGIRAAAGAGSGDARGAVAPFLNTEREFLQSLGTLVQAHAEEIKQMVMAIRRRSEPSAAGAASGASAGAGDSDSDASEPVEAVAGAGPALEPATAAEIRERLGTGEHEDRITLPGEDAEPAAEEHRPEGEPEPVVVDSGTEPVYSTEGSPAPERRERSLRELFWGEE